jgi:hypothetical protein
MLISLPEAKDLSLKLRIQSGYPVGIGVFSRATAYLIYLEAILGYMPRFSQVEPSGALSEYGFGLRFPVGERNEILFGIAYLSHSRQGFSPSENGFGLGFQFDRKPGRNSIGLNAGLGFKLIQQISGDVIYGGVMPEVKIGIYKILL